MDFNRIASRSLQSLGTVVSLVGSGGPVGTNDSCVI